MLGEPILDFQQFVDLLLVLYDSDADVRVFENVDHLVRDRVLIQRHRHAA
jgi:hypothetical protein